MRTRSISFAAMTLAALLSSAAAPASSAGADTTRCDATLVVTDPDPKGLNVRSAPDAKGSIVTVLKGGDYIEVHVTGQSGQWYAIDSATMIDTSLADQEKPIFHGHGFVHMSKVGASGMQSGAVILDRPDEKTGKKVAWDGQGDQAVTVLACSGPFLKVQLKKVTGWSKEICTNELTTCA
jgi:hypothetical protein